MASREGSSLLVQLAQWGAAIGLEEARQAL